MELLLLVLIGCLVAFLVSRFLGVDPTLAFIVVALIVAIAYFSGARI